MKFLGALISLDQEIPALAIKAMLHKVGVSNIECTFGGRDEMVEHIFWQSPSSKTFWAWFRLN